MLSQNLFIHYWTIVFTDVIDDIIGPIANAGSAGPPAAAKETASLPPGGLIEWNGWNTIWYGYPSMKWIENILGDSFGDSFWKGFGLMFWIVVTLCCIWICSGWHFTCIKDLYFWIELCNVDWYRWMCVSANDIIDWWMNVILCGFHFNFS